MSELLHILHFDEETRALEDAGNMLQASARLYEIWKGEPSSLPKLLRAATELWLTLLDIGQNGDDPREPFTENGLPEYEAMFREEIEAGISRFRRDPMFLAFFGHLFSAHFTFFLWLKDKSRKGWDTWFEKMLNMGTIACRLEPDNLFARAICLYIPDAAGTQAHREACAAFWAETPVSQWEHGYVNEHFWYELEGPSEKARQSPCVTAPPQGGG